MLNLIVGVSVAMAAVLGVLLGVWLGMETGKAESRAHAERIVSLDAEKKGLEASLAKEKELSKYAGEKLARAEEREKAQEDKYTQMRADLEKAFGNLAAEALRANNQSFLTLAKQELGGQASEAKLTLEAREQAIKTLLEPLGTALKGLDEQTRAMETLRSGAYSEVKTLVETIQKTIPASLEALKTETAQLVTALRNPKIRGNWGELQLKRCVEYAGMVQHCSFSEQVTARDENDNPRRPDMTVHLPNGREIVVDAKTPLDAFLDAGANADPAAQQLLFETHARSVKEHLKELSSKAYWKQFDKAPDFVVCFLPSEGLFSAALEADPSLIEFSAKNQVIMATPTTLIALLRAVEFGWQQSEITKNAKAIHETGRRIYDKLTVAQGHLEKLGGGLRSSVDFYNKFLGTVEGKGGVFFHGRQLGELTHGDGELEEIEKLQVEIREMESPEWERQPLLAIVASHAEPSELE